MSRRPRHLPAVPPRTSPALAPDQVLPVVEAAMHPLIQLLLASGVDYTRLAAELKPWFIEQAKAELLRCGRTVTDSSISLLSGVHRKDVRGWREQRLNAHIAEEVSIGAQIFARWTTDPAYRDRQRRPRSLVRIGAQPSFESLVRSVTQDVHPFTVLQELIRLNLVNIEIQKDREMVVPSQKEFIPPPGSQEALAMLGANLGDHSHAAVANLLGEEPQLEQSVFASGITAESAHHLGDLARKLWSHARGELINEATRLYDIDKLQKNATHRMRFGSYCWAAPVTPPGAPEEPDCGEEEK